ncbi:hypothetical protein ACFVYR_04720 [Streptomyces sp. NPDC058284]|uniref:5'-methylthioadenosine/S-adenosylhomocysteine nucleosidase family protein n=1 Tax=unclassified Streptomyces TaxID=2593676 RepID=UPI00365AB06B
MSNYGISNTGPGNVNVNGPTAMGKNTRVTVHGSETANAGDTADEALPAPTRAEEGARREQVWDAGVITVLPVENSATIDALARWGTHTERRTQQGVVFHEFTRAAGARTLRLSLTQSLLPGQHFAGSAVEHLRREYAPRLVALVGIAGSIHPDVRPGDVVIAQEVVHYEPRKVTSEGTRRRGRGHTVTAGVQHAINAFFTTHGEPWPLPGSEDHRALRGLIGSGEAVLADVSAEERRYLREYNEKILAVETEGAGLATAVHASTGQTGAAGAWVMVRGISDAADRQKDDSHHAIASRNAAYVFSALLPHLT